MHVHALVCVLAEVLRGRMDVCVCAFKGGGSRQEGQTVQPQDKLPPKKSVTAQHSARTLALCDRKARQGGAGGVRMWGCVGGGS